MLIAEGSFLSRLIGDDGKGGSPEIQWANLPESWGVFILIAIILAILFFVFWLYRREIDTCPRGVKMLLAVCRSVVMLLIVLFLLEPFLTMKNVRTLKPTVGMMRDGSISIDRADKYSDNAQVSRIAAATGWDVDDIKNGNYTRNQIMQQMFNRNSGDLIAKMRDKGSIRIVDFAESVNTIATIPALGEQQLDAAKGNEKNKKDDNQTKVANETANELQIDLNKFPVLVADGRGTDIWQAIREMLNDSSRLSAIVIATDGQHNGPGDPLEVARRAAELEIPIFVIPLGDPRPPKNLKVDSLFVRSKVRPDEPFEVEALLYANQVDQDKVRVDLIQQTVNSSTGKLEGEEVIKSVDLDVPPNGGRMRTTFNHTLANPGKFVYSVRIQNLDNETETSDNIKSTEVVQVVDEKVKVLLIAGAPNWEYRMVQRLLQRDKAISLSCWLQTMDEDRPQEGNEPISTLPRTIEELGVYNMVMMFDPNPNEFDNEWLKVLSQFVRRKAGGFLYMTGPKFSTEFVTMNKLDLIRDILPVRFGDSDMLETGQVLMTDISRPGKMLPVEFNLDHPVMKFDSDAAINKERWAEMPSIYWSFPTLAAKPTAKVLLERGDQVNVEGNQPLLVAGRFGAGNVLYMGFHGTWRWRRVGVQAQYFDRFWIQICRFLVETRSLQGKSRGIIDPDRTEYELGEKITLTARILDERFEPLKTPIVSATIKDENGRSRPIELKMLPGREGEYEAGFVAQQTGAFEVQVELGSEDDSEVIEPVGFRVDPPRVESNAYWLNENLLKQIATESGGKYITLDKIDSLPAELPRLETKTEINSPPIPLWDIKINVFNKEIPVRYLFFVLPVFLLTLEWSLRKKYKLL